MLQVEEAGEADRRAALDVIFAAYSQYGNEFSPEVWKVYRDNMEKVILHPNESMKILIVRNGDSIVGTTLYCGPNAGAVKSEYPEMRLLAVHPEARNLGIANLLIDECERLAASSGTMILHTTKLMVTAKAMYERRGYQRYPEIDFEPAPGFIVWGFKKVLNRQS